MLRYGSVVGMFVGIVMVVYSVIYILPENQTSGIVMSLFGLLVLTSNVYGYFRYRRQ